MTSHEFKDLKEPAQMMVLLTHNNVKHLIKMISIVSLDGRPNVSKQVVRCAISVPYNRCVKFLSSMLFKVNDQGTVVRLCDLLFLKDSLGLLHRLLFHLRFPRVICEINIELCVGFLVALDAQLSKVSPQDRK